MKTILSFIKKIWNQILTLLKIKKMSKQVFSFDTFTSITDCLADNKKLQVEINGVFYNVVDIDIMKGYFIVLIGSTPTYKTIKDITAIQCV